MFGQIELGNGHFAALYIEKAGKEISQVIEIRAAWFLEKSFLLIKYTKKVVRQKHKYPKILRLNKLSPMWAGIDSMYGSSGPHINM